MGDQLAPIHISQTPLAQGAGPHTPLLDSAQGIPISQPPLAQGAGSHTPLVDSAHVDDETGAVSFAENAQDADSRITLAENTQWDGSQAANSTAELAPSTPTRVSRKEHSADPLTTTPSPPSGSGAPEEWTEPPHFLYPGRQFKQSYGAKIDAIVRYLLHLRGTDPDAKSIVFSQVCLEGR